MVVEVGEFEQQISALAGRTVGWPAFEACLAGAESREGDCLVTFDDGYRDFTEFALPILERYGIPSVLFVSRAQSGPRQRLAPVDRWYEMLGQRQPIPAELVTGPRKRAFVRATPEEQRLLLAELRAELRAPLVRDPAADHYLGEGELGRLPPCVHLGGHGDDHVLLTCLDGERRRAALAACMSWIRSLCRHESVPFAYPNGDVSAAVARDVEAAGFACGFTVRRDSRGGRYYLGRVAVPRSFSLEEYSKRLACCNLRSGDRLQNPREIHAYDPLIFGAALRRLSSCYRVRD
ncbi:MAG: polysaccharide deacetylase family protein [Planctomycetaceae bacterium]